jgi:Na+-translocating ferredoxin:NAD+ oxidoreductase RnfD subunit
MNWTKLTVYAVSAVALCAVVLGIARDASNPVWAVLPAVFVAIYVAERDGGCSGRRRDDG